MPHKLLLAALCALPLLGHAQSFAPLAYYLMGSDPDALIAADVNGDTKPDIITTNRQQNALIVRLSNGDGTFQAAASYWVGSYNSVASVSVADVDSDGNPDLIASSTYGTAVAVLRGTGAGTFQAGVSYNLAAGGASAGTVATGDLNADGKPDITCLRSGNSLNVLLNSGSGAFPAAVSYSLAGLNASITTMTVADLNKDGYADVVVGTYGDHLGVLLGSATGSLSPITSYPVVASGSGLVNMQSVAVKDINADGNPDLVALCNTVASAPGYGSSALSVLLGTGLGTFQLVSTYPLSITSQAYGLALADYNLDGYLDVATVYSSLSYSRSYSTGLGLLPGNGNGTFQAAVTVPTGAPSSSTTYMAGLASADLNSDGRPDIVASFFYAGQIGLLLNSSVLSSQPTVAAATVYLCPNPAGTTAPILAVSGLPANLRTLDLEVLDMLGHRCAHLVVPIVKGAVATLVPSAGQLAGPYLLRLTAAGLPNEPVVKLPTQRLTIL